MAFFAGAVLAANSAGEGGVLSPAQIKAAQKLNVVKCAKCHALYDPKAYSAGEWRMWVQKMGRICKLKPEQEQLLVDLQNAPRQADLKPRNTRKTRK